MFDTTNSPIRIAHRSTRGEGAFAKTKWTEISVYFLQRPIFGVGHYAAVVAVCTAKGGERDTSTRWAGQTLEAVLEHIEDSKPGRAAKHEARAWDEANGIAMQRAADVPADLTDDEAIRLLYGDEAPDARGTTARLARDFGVAESTIRMGRAKGTPLKVPLAMVAALLDRSRLPSVRAEGDA